MHVPRFPRNYWILFLGGKLLGIFLKFKTNSGENIFNVQQIMGLSLFNFYPFTAPTLSCKKFKWPILPELRCIVLYRAHLSHPLQLRLILSFRRYKCLFSISSFDCCVVHNPTVFLRGYKSTPNVFIFGHLYQVNTREFFTSERGPCLYCL